MRGKSIRYERLIEIIETYFFKDELQKLLEDAGLKKTGTKKELSKRLVYEANYDPSYILSHLTKDVLFDICDELGIDISKSVPKQEIIENILKELGFVTSCRLKAIKNEEPLKTEKNVEKFKNICETLKDFEPYKIRREDDLERELVSFLKGRRIGNITPQKAGARSGNINVPDIVIEDIAIEVKYFDERKSRRSEWDKAIGQVIRYRIESGCKDVILFVVDKAGIVPEYYEEYERMLPWLKIIVK